jgi:glycosyltransferase involved in cell wall biosynthesis
MKIGFDAKRFFHNKTGLGNYSRSLVKLLSDAFPDNDYFLFNPKKSREFSIKNYSSKVIEVNPNNYLFKKINSLWRLFFISNTIKNYNIEIYHGLSGELPIGLSDKIKKIVTIHDLIFIRYPKLYNFFDRKIYYWKFKYAAKKADLIIAISEQTKKDIVEFLMINPKKIKVIYQGCQDVFKKIYTLEEKNQVYTKAPSGGPLVQHAVVAMFEAHHDGKISIEKIVEKMAHNPAKIFKIEKRGFIKVGYYADLVIVNPNKKWTVAKDNILAKCGWSPFEGFTFNSTISHTFVNGKLVYNNFVVNENLAGERLLFER